MNNPYTVVPSPADSAQMHEVHFNGAAIYKTFSIIDADSRAALLNEAYHKGYKQGFADAVESREENQ